MRCAFALVIVVAGCGDFPTPAELTKPTILAVVADPPLVDEGESTTLTVVVAGPDGPMVPDALDWTLIETLPGVPPFGALVANDDGTATYTAPDPLPELPDDAPPLDSVQLDVTVGEETLTSIKAVVVTPVPGVNPSITSMVVGEVEAEDGMHLASDVVYPISIDLDPAPGEDARYAWYSTVGAIEEYQSNPAELVAAEEPGDGWLFVVVRDGVGGVAWRGVEITVE
jgi:hypothetical protein